MVPVCTVHGRAGGELGRSAFLSGCGRSRKSGGLAPAAFPACTAAAMPTAPATSPSATSFAALSALTTLHTIAARLALLSRMALLSGLALLSRRLDAGARLATRQRRRGTGRRLHGTWADIPIPVASLLIPVVLTPPAITPIAAAAAAALGPTAFTITTATLAALGAAWLSGMLPPAVATPLATAAAH